MVALIQLALIAAALAGLWKAFEKMGRKGWEGIVPFYNVYILLQMTGRPVWWLALMLVPLVNVAVFIIVSIDVARGFAKGTGFGLGLGLLGFVFWPILGFGDAKWQGAPQPATYGFIPFPQTA
jgi:hypothetical protein